MMGAYQACHYHNEHLSPLGYMNMKQAISAAHRHNKLVRNLIFAI